MATAKEMWTSILYLFEPHTLFNKLAARRTFYRATMHQDEQPVIYINRVHQLASTVKSMGVEIDDKELAMAVLTLRQSDLCIGCSWDENDTFTLEFAKSRLFQEEQRMKMHMEATNVKSEASAFV